MSNVTFNNGNGGNSRAFDQWPFNQKIVYNGALCVKRDDDTAYRLDSGVLMTVPRDAMVDGLTVDQLIIDCPFDDINDVAQGGGYRSDGQRLMRLEGNDSFNLDSQVIVPTPLLTGIAKARHCNINVDG